jgi:hypothetical protein
MRRVPVQLSGTFKLPETFSGVPGMRSWGGDMAEMGQLGPASPVVAKLRWQLRGRSNSGQDSNEEEAVGNAGLLAKALTRTLDPLSQRPLNLGQDTLTNCARTDDTHNHSILKTHWPTTAGTEC